MSRMVRAILIDPFACTVTETEYDASKGLAEVYALLSHETMPVDLVTVAHCGLLKDGDSIYVDDEGLLKEPSRFFMVAGIERPLAGKGLIVGVDAKGHTQSAKTALGMAVTLTMFGEAVFVQDSVSIAVTRTPWAPPDKTA